MLIDAGRLRPGERIPPPRDLAAAVGLSRNTVSRVLDDLAAAGLLDAPAGLVQARCGAAGPASYVGKVPACRRLARGSGYRRRG